MNKAMSISQICWNLALLPEEKRDDLLNDVRASFQMDEDEFDEFRRAIVEPMIRRHQEMFPLMHRRISATAPPSDPAPRGLPSKASSREAYPGTDPYAPCPCQSGRKNKFCCRSKGR
jgi:hypothetical protein